MQEQFIPNNDVMTKRPDISTETKKILIVDTHPLLRHGLRQVIELEENLEVIGEASSADEAIYMINRDKPDLVIIDIALSGCMSGIELIRALNKRFPEVKVLVLTMHDEAFIAERAIRAGARGYIIKEVASKEIINAIKAVLINEYYLSDTISRKMIERFVRGSAETIGISVEKLSNREFEIFQFIGSGFTTSEIAKALNLSSYTIDAHKKNIKEKLKLKNSSDIVKSAIQWVIMQNK